VREGSNIVAGVDARDPPSDTARGEGNVSETEEEEVPPGGTEVHERPPWDPWHPREVAVRLRGVEVPWCVVGGWAIDLHRRVTSRMHEDTEIAIPAGRFEEFHGALSEFDLDVVGSGHIWPLDVREAFDAMHQTWVRDRKTGTYRLDIFREPHDGDVWICRRDRRIRRPYAEIIRTTEDGIPYMVPEIVLLFKAKHDQPKDNADFAGVLPLLDAAQRGWLIDALERVHPGHHWIGNLHG
jgi:Aminoglycoside-2''-adenylyltransferase